MAENDEGLLVFGKQSKSKLKRILLSNAKFSRDKFQIHVSIKSFALT